MERKSAIDREKVIKALKTCRKTDCAKCKYNTEVCLIDEIISDALALLKEQDAVEPKKVKGYNPPMYTLYEYECQKCKSPIMYKQPFCMGCGRAVKWT